VLLGDDDGTLHRAERACAPWRRHSGACSVPAVALKELPLRSRTTAASARTCLRRPTSRHLVGYVASRIIQEHAEYSVDIGITALLRAYTSVLGLHQGERVCIFAFPLSSNAFSVATMPLLLEANLAMHSVCPNAFLHLPCTVGVSLKFINMLKKSAKCKIIFCFY
jgi:hypothetical protein